MITPVQGTWTFSVWGEVRGRNVSRQQQLDLVMVELPDTVYLRYEDQEVGVASALWRSPLILPPPGAGR